MKNVEIAVPEWLLEVPMPELPIVSVEERVRFTLELARENIRQGTGGPFSAVLFDRETWKPVLLAVNVVTSSQRSLAHAEIMAILRANQQFGTFDLHDANLELVSSCEPCAMCYGAILWSGIRGLVYSGTKAHAEEIGFDEGDKPENWHQSYEKRGIYVQGPVLPDEGQRVLTDYADEQGIIYNATH